MTATVPSIEPTTNMSPTCHACGQLLGQIKAPILDLVPPAEATEKKKENKLNEMAKVNNTIGPGLPKVLGTLLDYVQEWIPGYHFVKRVLENFYRKTSPPTALAISPVHTVTSSNPIVSIAEKRKRPKHVKKPKSTPANPVQGRPPKSKLPVPASTFERLQIEKGTVHAPQCLSVFLRINVGRIGMASFHGPGRLLTRW
ncbi:hypothetical protein NEUTE2DRAFT_128641 [Neurospora tetrasperma FGSC 2509]|nr:hypothetical protein NEUTE2DRAFT_128641 [Neurospora tetrasperma FGSC 2509]